MDAPPTSLFLFLPLRRLHYAETAITLIVGARKLCADCKRLDLLAIWPIVLANFQQLLIFGRSKTVVAYCAGGCSPVDKGQIGLSRQRRAGTQVRHGRVQSRRNTFFILLIVFTSALNGIDGEEGRESWRACSNGVSFNFLLKAMVIKVSKFTAS
jgi:hypothetical protein